MPSAVGSERVAARTWATAGAIGAALGPAAGGLLTELVSWQSIFLFQVPPAILVAIPLLPVARRESVDATRRAELRDTGRPHLPANLALALVSGALAAALFLIVLLIIEGWRHSPIVAALAVSVMPIAALATAPLARTVSIRSEGRRRRDPRGGRPRRARPPSEGCDRRHVVPPVPDPRRRRSRPGAVGVDGDRPGGAGPAGDPRRLDDRRTPRRGGGRATGADTPIFTHAAPPGTFRLAVHFLPNVPFGGTSGFVGLNRIAGASGTAYRLASLGFFFTWPPAGASRCSFGAQPLGRSARYLVAHPAARGLRNFLRGSGRTRCVRDFRTVRGCCMCAISVAVWRVSVRHFPHLGVRHSRAGRRHGVCFSLVNFVRVQRSKSRVTIRAYHSNQVR